MRGGAGQSADGRWQLGVAARNARTPQGPGGTAVQRLGGISGAAVGEASQWRAMLWARWWHRADLCVHIVKLFRVQGSPCIPQDLHIGIYRFACPGPVSSNLLHCLPHGPHSGFEASLLQAARHHFTRVFSVEFAKGGGEGCAARGVADSLRPGRCEESDDLS